MPDAAPAICGEMLRMATVVIGAKVMPMPAPAMMAGTRKFIHVESGPGTNVTRLKPMGNKEMPVSAMDLPPIVSASRPAKGGATIGMGDIGADGRPAARAAKPRPGRGEV